MYSANKEIGLEINVLFYAIIKLIRPSVLLVYFFIFVNINVDIFFYLFQYVERMNYSSMSIIF